MAKQPLGKTLLRNVIRHTDAHNKIQEEIEMWKTRDWQVHSSHNKHMPDTKSVRGQMHCDRTSDQPRYLSQSRNRVSEHDDREARYWSRKLYEFEAGDPDSGFKELYPEEFESDSEKTSSTRKVRRHKMKKSKSDREASLSKRSKKSSRKKKKKKKDEEEKRKKDKCSSSDSSSTDSSATKDRQQRKKTKSRHKNKKTGKKQRRDEDSSSSDGDGKEERERGNQRRKKRKLDCHKESDSGPDTKKKC
uniref:NKAP domain containing 1 n=1 Tax=Gasterosteus aculeatus aculeatus TaxID=481459 RepID=A0AAQ4NXC7_GASAC